MNNGKNERIAESKANELMMIDNMTWDLMGIQSGSDFMNDDLTTLNVKMFEDYKTILRIAFERAKIKTVSKRVHEILEDSNYHKLNQALREMGM